MPEEKFNFTVGIIGVGFLGQCLVEGLSKVGENIVLSPRNIKRTTALSKQFNCIVAEDNSEVVRKCDLIILATLPKDLAATAKDLPWQKDQCVISIAAGINLSTIEAAVTPAKAFRAMPISAVRLLEGPTAFYPLDDRIFELFDSLGSAHPLEDEKKFEVASIFGAFYGQIYALIDEVSNWAESNGLDAEYSRVLTSRMIESAAKNVIENSSQRPRKLLDDLLTKGGITEACLEVLDTTGALQKWQEALDSSLERSRKLNSNIA